MFSEVVREKLRKVDVYRQVSTDLAEPTIAGACLSVIVLSCMAVLFCAELAAYLKPVTRSDMYVDINRGSELMTINLDLTLHRYPCALVSLDMVDIVGKYAVNIETTLVKQRLAADGTSIGMSPDFEPLVAKAQLTGKEGCRLTGHLVVNTVPGRFGVSSSAYNEFLGVIMDHDMAKLDFSHTIHHLSFGQNIEAIQSAFTEGILNPLDGTVKLKTSSDPLSYEYYVKVVPTEYSDGQGQEYSVNQFSATSNEMLNRGGLPSLSFRYDLSPVTVRFYRNDLSAFHFFIQICAIVGGVYTAGGLIDSLLSTASKSLNKKS